jgi:flagella basal body P-ring formation protein FlgA
MAAPSEDLLRATETALRDRGMDGRLQITLLSASDPTLAFQRQAALEVQIGALDLTTGRFTGIVTGRTPEGLRQLRIGGRVDQLVQVPVPARAIAAGERVAAADLSWIELSTSRLQSHLVTSEAALVGLVARRGLRAGRPVSARDVEQPIMIQKGALVTMTVVGLGLVLTATGQALDDGAEGQQIALINTQSKRTVQGTVIGPDRVRIDAARQTALR